MGKQQPLGHGRGVLCAMPQFQAQESGRHGLQWSGSSSFCSGTWCRATCSVCVRMRAMERPVCRCSLGLVRRRVWLRQTVQRVLDEALGANDFSSAQIVTGRRATQMCKAAALVQRVQCVYRAFAGVPRCGGTAGGSQHPVDLRPRRRRSSGNFIRQRSDRAWCSPSRLP